MARSFNGSSQWLEKSSWTPPSFYPITVACWSYNLGGGLVMVALNNDTVGAGGSDWFRLYAPGGSLYWQPKASGTSAFGGGMSIADNVWNHCCGVSSSSTSHVAYKNGSTSGGSTDTTNVTPSGIDNISVGATIKNHPAENYNMWNGYLSEVAVWSAALTAAEVLMLSQGFSPAFIRPQSLAFYAPLIRGASASGGNDNDVRGGLVLTDHGTVTVASHPRIILPSKKKVMRYGSSAAATPRTPYFYQMLAAG